MLGRKARIVELPNPVGSDSTDITEYFRRDGYTTADFNALVDKFRGQRLFTMADALNERDDLRKQQGLYTGWPSLDHAIHPGLLPGQVVVVLAKTGAGKTALLTQLAHNLSSWQTYGGQYTGPSVPTMVLSLEQTKAEIGERLERIGRLFNPWLQRDDLVHWYSKMQLCDENKIPPADVPLLIEEFIDDVGMAPKLMVVDYLGYWARAFSGKSKYEEVSEAIMELKRLAKEHQIAVIAPHQVSRLGRRGERLELDFARDSGVVEETSDFVLSLYKPGESRADKEDYTWRDAAEVKLEILKSRHGSVGRVLTFLWAPYSLAIVERDGDPVLVNRVEKEWSALDQHWRYDDVQKLHTGMKFLHD
jgi:replicative DNA helicase